MAEIKIRELSIGDWVMNLYANKPSRVIGLRTMFQDTYEIIAVSDDTQYMLIEDNKELHNFEPIPLTPEILEKNGFEELKDKSWVGHNHHCHIQQHRSSWTLLANKRGFYRTIRFEGLEFVHQLQHALRLAGVEKEIEV
jgi:hypothetical protein